MHYFITKYLWLQRSISGNYDLNFPEFINEVYIFQQSQVEIFSHFSENANEGIFSSAETLLPIGGQCH